MWKGLRIGSPDDEKATEYWSTLRKGEKHIKHVRLIGSGGYGEVHEVLAFHFIGLIIDV